MSAAVNDALSAFNKDTEATGAFVDQLTNLDFFVLDNSLRESTVGQLRGHTLENKQAIYKIVKSLNVHGMIVASFSNMHRVDDEFCKWLVAEGEDFSKLWSFSEVYSGKVVNGRPTNDKLPDGLAKNKEFGIYNTVLEIDLADANHTWGTGWTIEECCALLEERMDFVYNEINKEAKIFVNIRDVAVVMAKAPKRCLTIVEHLAKMPKDRRPFGIVFEDPFGDSMYQMAGAWCKAIRTVMSANGWNGHLLNHIHERWEMQTAATLECLANGGDGVWASVCVEGAAMGHASSCVTLTNLIRLGNTKVLESMNCTKFRQAAIDVTKITTNHPPHPKQCVYGKRAVDLVFGFIGVGDFNLGDFFGERTTNRMTTLVTPEMIVDQLNFLFGKDPQFTVEMANKMKEKMLEDLNSVPPRKEEYQSAMGIAMLFDRCGGKLTAAMSDAIAKVQLSDPHHERIVAEIRAEWDNWDAREASVKDDQLEFDSFYHGFLQPYFGCYRCVETKQALKAIDMDSDGYVDWNEFLVYIKWALRQYPEMTNADEVLEVAFQQGLIPASRDEKV